jgi:PAS domain S-box-containing protein
MHDANGPKGRLSAAPTPLLPHAYARIGRHLQGWRGRRPPSRGQGGGQGLWYSAVPLLVYAVAYLVAQFAAAKLAYAIAPRIQGPSPLVIHGGVAVAALMLTPPRRWWLPLLLTLPLIVIDVRLLGLPPSLAVFWVVVVAFLQVVIVAVVTASLLRQVTVLPLHFASVAEVSRFVACVAVGALPASLFSTTARTVIWSDSFWFDWQTAYLGFILGIVTFVPMIALWATDGNRALARATRPQRTEAALLGLATVVIGVLVFGTHVQDDVVAYGLIYMLIPLLIWAAVRFGPLGFATALAVSTAIAVTGAANGRGPFVSGSVQVNVLALQLYLLFVGVPLFFLAALVQEREQAGVALQASEARYRATFDSAAIGAAVVDLDGRPLEVNAYFSRMLGYTPDELCRMGLRDFTHPDDVAENEAPLRRAVEGAIGSYQLEKRYLHQDGHLVWGRVSASLVRDPDGHPAYLVAHIEDVTLRKQLERERAEQTAQMDRIFEGIADGLVVYDAEGQVVRTNPALRRLLEVDDAPEITIPFPAAERAPLFAPRDTDGRLLPPEKGPLARVLRGEASEGAIEQDVLLRTLNGREVEGATRTAPLRDGEGRLLGAVSILHDQTERKRLEREREAARAQAERRAEEFDRIFETMADGVFVYDANGRLVRTNAAVQQLLGLDVAPSNFLELPRQERRALFHLCDTDGRPIPPEHAASQRALHGEVLSGARALLTTLRSLDGRELALSVSAAPLRDRDGRIVGAVSILHDRTERNQLEREREAAIAQLAALYAVTDTALTHLGLDDVLQAVLERIHGVLGLDHAAIRLLEPDGHKLSPATAIQGDAALNAPYPLELGQGFAGRIAASREPLVVDDMAGFPVIDAAVGARLRSAVGVPLLLDGRLLGVLYSGSTTPRHFSDHDVRLLQLLADRVAVAVDRARLFEAERAARADAEQRQEELDRVFEQMSEGVVVYDRQGRLVRMNAAQRRLEGLSDGATDNDPSALAERMALFTARDEQDHPLAPEEGPLPRALRGEGLDRAETMDIRARTLDGREVELSVSAATLRDTDGHAAGAVAVFRDLTERNQLAREREAALARAWARSAELEAVLGAMTDGVVVYDRTGRGTYVNPALRAMSAEHVPPTYEHLSLPERGALTRLRTPAGEVVPDDQLPQARLLRGEVLAGAASPELLFDAQDGRILTVQYSGSPLRNETGALTGAVMVLRNVTNKRRLEREREQERARAQARSAELEAVLGAMADGVIVYDADGNLSYTNAAFRALFAVDARPDYARLSLAEHAGLMRARTADGRLLTAEQLPQARVLRGEVLLGDAMPDLVGDALDGRVLTLHVAGSPLRDTAGGITGAVLVFRDVAEQRHLQRATQELAAQLEATLDAMSDAVFLYGTDGQVLRLNTAAQVLVDAEPEFPSIDGTSWWERVRRHNPRRLDGRPLSLEEWPLARVLRGETLTSVDVQDIVLTDAQGLEQVLNYTGGPARDVVGKLMGYVFVVRDVTERRRLQRKWEEARANELALREVNERLDTFASVAAHDLRSPVGVSRIMVQRAQQVLRQAAAAVEPGSETDVRAFGKIAMALVSTEQNLDRVLRLVQQLLDATRLRQGTLVLNRQPLNLVELVRSSVEEQRLLNPGRTFELDFSGLAGGDDEAVIVEADGDRLGQALTNYLTNAVRYSPEDQPIEVTLRTVVELTEGVPGDGAEVNQERQPRRVARVEVRDHGEGVSPEDLSTIWNRFQRARSTREASGLGLGLYIVRTMVEMHGGPVGVESVLGQGSTFWFSLPLTEPVRVEPRADAAGDDRSPSRPSDDT